MIAEDEALIRLDLAEMLAEEGYEVVGQAGDGEAAIALAMEHRPDLVVMDVKMPKLDGIAAASQIAAARIAPVVMLTAFSQRELVERARDAGAMAYLVKPFSKSDLVPAIEMAMSRFAEITALEKEVGDLIGPAGDPQGGRARQVDAAGGAGPHRAGGVQLDPAHRDGSEAPDAAGCAGRHRPRTRAAARQLKATAETLK